MQPSKKSTPLALSPSKSYILHEPKGVVLIIAPWNYPFNLSISPLIGAIAAGNCAVLKPSEEAPETAAIIEDLLNGIFTSRYISVLQGIGKDVIPATLDKNIYNHIFFTGSTAVGSAIAKQAAEKLVSTTLELGGKSPAIVDASANLKVAAKRLVWGKFTNSGQTCVSPDYVLVEDSIEGILIDEMKHSLETFYGKDPSDSPDYPRMINTKRFDTVVSYLEQGEVAIGGSHNRTDLYIAPTILRKVDMDAPIIKEEIFGPILPIIPFKSFEEILSIVRKNRYPLSCYYFGKDKAMKEAVLKRIEFGGGCINNSLVHLGNPDLPFGGIQKSGSGHYHGYYSFECFSNAKSIVDTANWLDPSIKYPPYTGAKLRWLKRLLKL